jgi:hypothetical protein
MRRKSALRDELDEKLEAFFVRGRDDRVSALDAVAFVLDAECGVLSGLKGKRAARVNTDQPQIFRQISALDDARRKVSVRGQSQAHKPPLQILLLVIYKQRPGGAATCFARCSGIDTLPPGDELIISSEAILTIFGLVCASQLGKLGPAVNDKMAARGTQPAALYTRLAFLRGEEWSAGGRVEGNQDIQASRMLANSILL